MSVLFNSQLKNYELDKCKNNKDYLAKIILTKIMIGLPAYELRFQKYAQ